MLFESCCTHPVNGIHEYAAIERRSFLASLVLASVGESKLSVLASYALCIAASCTSGVLRVPCQTASIRSTAVTRVKTAGERETRYQYEIKSPIARMTTCLGRVFWVGTRHDPYVA
jgi:hypothetical protein